MLIETKHKRKRATVFCHQCVFINQSVLKQLVSRGIVPVYNTEIVLIDTHFFFQAREASIMEEKYNL